MGDLKKMYTTVVDDPFPAELVIRLGEAELAFRQAVLDHRRPGKGLALRRESGSAGRALRAGFRAPEPGRRVEFAVRATGWCAPPPRNICSSRASTRARPTSPTWTTASTSSSTFRPSPPWSSSSTTIPAAPPGPTKAWKPPSLAAYGADRIAAFGGAVVVNRTMDVPTARRINAVYMEVVAAPDYEPEALAILKSKKNLRIFKLPGLAQLDKLVGQPFLDYQVPGRRRPGAPVLLPQPHPHAAGLPARPGHGQGRDHPHGPGALAPRGRGPAFCLGRGSRRQLQFRHFRPQRRHRGHRHRRAGPGRRGGIDHPQGQDQVRRFPGLTPKPACPCTN